MADDTTDAPSSGKRFPFINLEKALERAGQIYAADRNGRPMAVATAFEVWGYSDKSSGGHQTVAALKGYGIVESERGPGPTKLSLTPNGLRYFRDERDEEKLRLRKLFALRPKLIAKLWRDWGDAPPADNVARSHLKVELALGEQQARALLGIYKENLAFAELKSDDKVAEQERDDEDDKELEASTNREAPPKVDAGGKPAKDVSITLGGGRVSIEGSVDAAGLRLLRLKLEKAQEILDLDAGDKPKN